MHSPSFMIDVAGLSKTFSGKTAVYDFSLQAHKGEIIGFLGPNGSGKTTTIRMLCGLLQPDSGHGTCLGFDLFKESAQVRSRVGYMTQRFSLYHYLTILENLEFIAQAFAVKNPKQRVAFIIDRLGLKKRQHQRTEMLSGGWKQRLALAAAILHEPQLLLLDEPTAGVDPQARHDFWQIISDLAAEGMTILVSTHYMDEAERCHRIVYLAYGKLVTQGTIAEIIKNAHLSTWQVSGKDINQLSKQLAHQAGVEQVTHFGVNLHVSGQDRTALINTLRPYLLDLDYNWKGVEPTLDDIFVNLIAKIQEERFD